MLLGRGTRVFVDAEFTGVIVSANQQFCLTILLDNII